MILPSWSRREAMLAVPTLVIASGLPAAEDRMPVVDTHLHCFAGKDDARFPYHKDGPYQPVDAATPEHLLQCMAGAGVDYAVVVHPEPYQDDHEYLEHCLAVGKGKLKGTCLFFADRADTAKRMTNLAKRVPLVAARIHAYAPDRLPPFGKPELRNLWKLASDLGLAVQLHFEPRYAPGFEPLIKEFPTTRVFIDHLGRPFQGTPKEHAVVVGWSKYDHVVMKLSSLPDKGSYPHRDPGKVVKELTDAFGADRLMYGGGYNANATGASYRAARTRLGEYLTHLSDTDRAKVFGGTAAKLMGFGKA
jgi:predicted TIM-barrel fold metal-dependent hydrolase